MDKSAILRQYFGHSSFRGGQEELIDAILAGRDVLGIMPTGGGKSVCYQVPALMLPGLSLVISPLISLMKDQVAALEAAGIPAAFVNSSMTSGEFQVVCAGIRGGLYRLLYVAPERLDNEGFLSLIRSQQVPLVAVDEAHCVSQWGQDFRPSYLNIPDFLARLRKRPALGAFTATATPEVREDIVRRLALREPQVSVSGFDRANLSFEVRQPRSKKKELLAFLAGHEGESGILYCSTRKTVDGLWEYLRQRGLSAVRYHAGLEAEERRQNQEAFAYGQAQLMVATNAFGMGIDKSDVRFVVHYNMPKDLESYYQEAGRAGRDGEPAQCLLLFGGQDVVTARYLISLREENDDADEDAYRQRVERDTGRLKTMEAYCRTTDCLRGFILRYFGERAPAQCGNCGNCLIEFEDADITEDAQKILSCVKRAGERFGAVVIADVLRGAKTDRIRSWQLDKLTTYGIMPAMQNRDILDRIRLLVERGYLRQSDGQYPTLSLAPAAREVLFHGEQVSMRLPRAKPAGPAGPGGEPSDLLPARMGDEALFQDLRALRGRLASLRGVPPYVIFSDRTLREMCRQRPDSSAAFLQVPGVGERKLEQFGEAFLEIIRKHGV